MKYIKSGFAMNKIKTGWLWLAANIVITAGVRAWQNENQGANIVFMINSNHQDINARKNSKCLERFNNDLLIVTYFA